MGSSSSDKVTWIPHQSISENVGQYRYVVAVSCDGTAMVTWLRSILCLLLVRPHCLYTCRYKIVSTHGNAQLLKMGRPFNISAHTLRNNDTFISMSWILINAWCNRQCVSLSIFWYSPRCLPPVIEWVLCCITGWVTLAATETCDSDGDRHCTLVQRRGDHLYKTLPLSRGQKHSKTAHYCEIDNSRSGTPPSCVSHT